MTTDGIRRTRPAAAAALLAGVLVLTACSGSGEADSKGSDAGDRATSPAPAGRSAATDRSDARITITPKDGTNDAGINNDVKVTVADGKLTKVAMTTAGTGTEVPGSLSADGTTWKPDSRLQRATRYRITAEAEDGRGRTVLADATVGTVSPGSSFIGYFTPEDGSTVGVGMPVSINFDKAIANKADVQSGIRVTSSSGQSVVGHWFSATRLDFRPQTYWKPGSAVTVNLDLDDVEGAPGIKGVQDKTVRFTVGRSQVSTVDAVTKQMTVVRDGKTIKTIPITTGSPGNETYNGQMVISEKFKETRLNGATVGFKNKDGTPEYDIKDVPHAMRLSTSGTYIHGNYWAADSVFGSVNTSHGCVGLKDVKGANDPGQPAAWFFDNSLIGDVVIVKNSKDRTIAADNGLNGWNMPWKEWAAGSATG
ncbi:L,D-transpeptidase [Streptomyces werraensis]|uniref:L,D-transpeptidase n=1 Tax=Streptomyces werraensis TaxID=68284 RepID=UPI0033BE5E9C